MKFSFKFSNLLGTVYRKGNLLFSPDGNSVFSPVGNRITIFDLKNNKSETLPVENQMDITTLALSPDGNLLIAVNEEGEAMLISLISRSVLHYYHFHRKVHDIKFSPDGKKFAVTKENSVLIFHAPGKTKEFNPFQLHKTFYGFYDEAVCLDWTSDSKAFLAGGKDMNTRVFGAERYENLIIYSLGGHTDCIVGAFFEKDSLDVYTLSRNGQLRVWEADTEPEDLRVWTAVVQRDGDTDTDSEGDDDGEDASRRQAEKEAKEAEEKKEQMLKYKRVAKHNYREARSEYAGLSLVTAATYHKHSHILVTGFEDGAFFLHEMPDFNLIHSLSISEQSISAVTFNASGEWLALGCSGLGQLLVWEWQSESYVLKQQGHYHNMACMEYSPDGQYIATGGDDGKVKVWNTSSGFCFVTFNEHLAGITGVTFNQKGQVVLSSSLDGTVRAFDLNRYRNFRTFTSPRPVQFSCLTVDHSGDLVCAGGRDTYEVFVWSMTTGRLLEILSGHEGPISALSFCATHSILVSGSWDHTVRLWDVFQSRGAKEVIQLQSDALCVAYRPDGHEVAVSALDGQITLWDVHTATQTGTIEGRADLGYTRKELDKMTAKKSSLNKTFTSLCYTADGACLLAAGRSKNVCIYSVQDQILLRKFEITCNLSFDGTEEFLDRRKMTEFGSLSLVEEGQGERGGHDIALPGVRVGDKSSRHWKPEVRVSAISFSPTGRAWAATTTEGLLVYSLDHSLVFDPFELELDVTPASVRQCMAEGSHSSALMLAHRLNEQGLIQEVMEATPAADVDLLCQSLPDVYVDKTMSFLASQLESSAHIEFYLIWCRTILTRHGAKLKPRSAQLGAVLRSLLKNLGRRHDDLAKVCDHNKYTLQYLISLSKLKRKSPPGHDEDTTQDASKDDSAVLQSQEAGDSSEEELPMAWDSDENEQ